MLHAEGVKEAKTSWHAGYSWIQASEPVHAAEESRWRAMTSLQQIGRDVVLWPVGGRRARGNREDTRAVQIAMPRGHDRSSSV